MSSAVRQRSAGRAAGTAAHAAVAHAGLPTADRTGELCGTVTAPSRRAPRQWIMADLSARSGRQMNAAVGSARRATRAPPAPIPDAEAVDPHARCRHIRWTTPMPWRRARDSPVIRRPNGACRRSRSGARPHSAHIAHVDDRQSAAPAQGARAERGGRRRGCRLPSGAAQAGAERIRDASAPEPARQVCASHQADIRACTVSWHGRGIQYSAATAHGTAAHADYGRSPFASRRLMSWITCGGHATQGA